MILVKQNITVDEVEYGNGMAKTVSVVIKSNGNKKRKIVTTYIPPRTNAWDINEYKQMQQETKNSITDMIESDNTVLLVGDFNCKEVNWEELELEDGAGAWCEELLQTMMVNSMDQWVNQATRCRGEGEPSMLDLVFTKSPEGRPDIQYQSPLLGKNDHMVLEIKPDRDEVILRSEEHRKERRNYAKTNFRELRDFFGQINWKEILKDKQVQEKYEIFLSMYEKGVQKFVPSYKVKKGKFELFCRSKKRKGSSMEENDETWKTRHERRIQKG